MRDSLSLKRRVLDEESLAVAQTLNGLAELYEGQEKYADAERYYRRVLEIRERILPPAHFLVVETVKNLAIFCNARRQFAKAAEFKQRYAGTLVGKKKFLKQRHWAESSYSGNLAV